MNHGQNTGWAKGAAPARVGAGALVDALAALETPLVCVATPDGPGVLDGREIGLSGPAPAGALPMLAFVPPLPPDRLGDPTFLADHGVAVPYVTGAMANGIGSTAIVAEVSKHGGLGFFGSAGLSLPRIEAAIDEIQRAVGDLPYGFNLIHSPQEPGHEQATVDLYLTRGVRTIETAAFLKLQPTIVQYRCTGLRRGADGRVVARNRVIAKVSREEVAIQLLRPAPEKMLQALVAAGRLTAEEAALARELPIASDLTAEADSGGHTDNQAANVLLPRMLGLARRVAAETGLPPARVGAAGGIATPESVAAAFAIGAAYVVTGTVNQACVESGTSDLARALLAEAGPADVAMAPASDMFEAGVQVQVLARGTLYPMRARRLYDLWRSHGSLQELPPEEVARLEGQVFRRKLGDVWEDCVAFFRERDPSQLERAEREPKHQMALVFRWYLGMSSRWAIAGDASRKTDAQIWCGPAIGAFNEWTRGTFLADPAQRRVGVVMANLLFGGAFLSRARILREQGVDPGPSARTFVPRPLE